MVFAGTGAVLKTDVFVYSFQDENTVLFRVYSIKYILHEINFKYF